VLASAIAAADQTFAVLAARPCPLVFDGQGIPGLPEEHLEVRRLRDLLAGSTGSRPILPSQTVDLVWRRLAEQARTWGPAWVVAAVGLAVPALTRLARRLSTGQPHLAEDIDSEIVAGFLDAVRTHDLDAPRLWLRLTWAAWRAGDRARQVRETVDLPNDLPAAASAPRVPYGHPDLLLGRAVAAGVLTSYQADLIGDTRIGDVLIEQLAEEQGVSAPVLRMRRHRAEQVLVSALRQGELSDVVVGAPSRRSGTARRTHEHRLS
jgi:hypothetical protein